MYTLAIGMPSGFEWIIIAGIGLLIFGKRLPEVGRSLGKGIVEFKKGLKGVEDDVSQVDPQPMPATRAQIAPAARSISSIHIPGNRLASKTPCRLPKPPTPHRTRPKSRLRTLEMQSTEFRSGNGAKDDCPVS